MISLRLGFPLTGLRLGRVSKAAEVGFLIAGYNSCHPTNKALIL